MISREIFHSEPVFNGNIDPAALFQTGGCLLQHFMVRVFAAHIAFRVFQDADQHDGIIFFRYHDIFEIPDHDPDSVEVLMPPGIDHRTSFGKFDAVDAACPFRKSTRHGTHSGSDLQHAVLTADVHRNRDVFPLTDQMIKDRPGGKNLPAVFIIGCRFHDIQDSVFYVIPVAVKILSAVILIIQRDFSDLLLLVLIRHCLVPLIFSNMNWNRSGPKRLNIIALFSRSL